jgi:ABC-type transporter Mla MlaB component
MAFVTEHQATGARLVLSGDVTVTEATPLYAAVVELSGVAGAITVDDTRVTGFDVSLLQLLLALSRERRVQGRAFALTDGPAARHLATLGLSSELD